MIGIAAAAVLAVFFAVFSIWAASNIARLRADVAVERANGQRRLQELPREILDFEKRWGCSIAISCEWRSEVVTGGYMEICLRFASDVAPERRPLGSMCGQTIAECLKRQEAVFQADLRQMAIRRREGFRP